MSRNLLVTCALLACATMLSGCQLESGTNGPSGPGQPTPAVPVNGTWMGMATVPELGTQSRLTLSLQLAGSDVTGNWQLADLEGVVLFSGAVTGSYLDSNVGLTLRRSGAAAVTAVGGVPHGGTTLELRIRAPGWTPTDFSLIRQQGF